MAGLDPVGAEIGIRSAALRLKHHAAVMAELVPAIHAVAPSSAPQDVLAPLTPPLSGSAATLAALHGVDGRDKPGHDGRLGLFARSGDHRLISAPMPATSAGMTSDLAPH